MERSAMELIASRLASVDGLYFPGAFVHRDTGPPDASCRKNALLDLLSRDVPIFLERYGSELTADELREFEKLEQDYEVRWHLVRLRSRRNPTPDDARARSVAVRNRRRAHMERLVQAGEYFSEDAMREREPYLHHEYLGKFQDPVGRGMSRPGERWSETLMRRCEEAMIIDKIREEQQRLGVDPKEWVGAGREQEEIEEMEEEDEEEEEDDEDGEDEEEDEYEDMIERNDESKMSSSKIAENQSTNVNAQDGQSSTVGVAWEPTISAEEMLDRLDQFTNIMQQKFLAGEDVDHQDYSQIDNDERLDDHWLREANYDAEEKYFEED